MENLILLVQFQILLQLWDYYLRLKIAAEHLETTFAC